MSSVWETLARALSPVEDRPRLAAHLESATYTTRSGAEYVVLHNPTTRAYARLDPREFALLPLMDGQHSVKELVIAYYQRYGVLALSRVAGLVQLLRTQGFLADPAVDVYGLLRGQRRAASTVRSFTTRTVDRVLGEMYLAWGHIFFHRAWLFIGVGLGLLGPLLVITELARGRYVLYELGTSALLTGV